MGEGAHRWLMVMSSSSAGWEQARIWYLKPMVIRSYSCAHPHGVSRRQRERAAGARTLFMLEVLRRMMEEWASLSKICRAEAELYSSCGLNSSAMKSGVNIARTTSWRTAHSDRWTSG